MKNLSILIALLVIPVHTVADEWRTSDTLREAAFITLMAIDCSQTLHIKHDATLHEGNPILGRNPSDEEIVTYFLTASAIHILAVSLLPHDWREFIQAISIGIEISTIAHNMYFQGGLHLTF